MRQRKANRGFIDIFLGQGRDRRAAVPPHILLSVLGGDGEEVLPGCDR